MDGHEGYLATLTPVAANTVFRALPRGYKWHHLRILIPNVTMTANVHIGLSNSEPATGSKAGDATATPEEGGNGSIQKSATITLGFGGAYLEFHELDRERVVIATADTGYAGTYSLLLVGTIEPCN